MTPDQIFWVVCLVSVLYTSHSAWKLFLQHKKDIHMEEIYVPSDFHRESVVAEATVWSEHLRKYEKLGDKIQLAIAVDVVATGMEEFLKSSNCCKIVEGE